MPYYLFYGFFDTTSTLTAHLTPHDTKQVVRYMQIVKQKTLYKLELENSIKTYNTFYLSL